MGNWGDFTPISGVMGPYLQLVGGLVGINYDYWTTFFIQQAPTLCLY